MGTIKDRMMEMNEVDFKHIFNMTQTTFNVNEYIKKLPEEDNYEWTIRELDAYDMFDPGIGTGDVIFLDGELWVVTCCYTDKTIDVISASGIIRRGNIGLYGKEFHIVDSLEVIEVETMFDKNENTALTV